MTETRELLERIAAIRHRLGQAQGMLLEAHCEAADLAQIPPAPAKIADAIAGGERIQALIDGSLRQLADVVTVPAPPATQALTNRARRTAERCRMLVNELQSLGDDAVINSADAEAPLTACHRYCTALAESAVRLVQTIPADAGTQTRLCEGVDGLLDLLAEKIDGLRTARDRQARQDDRIATLAHWLGELQAGRRLALAPFTALAEAVACDARQGEPLFVHMPGAASPAAGDDVAKAWRSRFVASQALTAAQVAARAFADAADFDSLLLAILVADVGMMDVSPAVLAQPGRLTTDQWRLIEKHPRRGAELLFSCTAADALVIEAVRDHHERPDGTGYPAGNWGASPMASQVAVCMVYAALLAPRRHRDARDPQSALTETLLIAEREGLDRTVASTLRRLSFFPIGCVVELDDGTVGVVVATHTQKEALPIVALLTDAEGHKLPGPQVTDLAAQPNRAVARTLSVADRCRRLGAMYPQFA